MLRLLLAIFVIVCVHFCNAECPPGLELNLDKPSEFIVGIVALDYQQLMHKSARSEKSKSTTKVLEAAIDKTLLPEKRTEEMERLTALTARLFQNGGNKINSCLTKAADALNKTCAANKETVAGSRACYASAALSLWTDHRFDAGWWDHACLHSKLAQPCLLFIQFLDHQLHLSQHGKDDGFEGPTGFLKERHAAVVKSMNSFLDKCRPHESDAEIKLLETVAEGCGGDVAKCDKLRQDFSNIVQACDAQTFSLIHSLKPEAYASALKACNLGSPVGCEQAFDILLNGVDGKFDGIPPEVMNPPEAKFGLLERGCEFGSAQSCFQYGLYLRMDIKSIKYSKEKFLEAKKFLDKSITLTNPPEEAFQELADNYGWGKYEFPQDKQTVIDIVTKACLKINRMCVQLAWIYETGYGGVPIDMKKSSSYSKQGCMFGETMSCLHFLRLREAFVPLHSFVQPPPFADPKSREFYERAVLGTLPSTPKATATPARANSHLLAYKEMLIERLRVSTQTHFYRAAKSFSQFEKNIQIYPKKKGSKCPMGYG